MCITTQKAPAQGVSVDFQVFYDELSPYGTWVESPDYGYVWVPDVAPGFASYATNGYWVFTDDGWTWVSNYSWGWAPFHYGRWYTDPTYGPMWVPDTEWGPGWVTWRRSRSYYGWAPIAPGVSVNVAYSNNYNVPNNQWTFVRNDNFGRRNAHNYYVNSSNNVTIINNSTVINNTRIDNKRNVTYNAGPERAEVEKRAGRKFTPIAIKESNKPGQNLGKNQLQIYRPRVEKSIPTRSKPIPTKVANLKNVKTSTQRTAEYPKQKANQRTNQKLSNPQQAKPLQNTGVKKQTQPKRQPAKQQLSQPQQNRQSAKQKPSQSQQVNPSKKVDRVKQPQQAKPIQNTGVKKQTQPARQPAKQQLSQPQPTRQPAKQQLSQPQPARQPAIQQLSQPQPVRQPAIQKPAQPQQANPSGKAERVKQPKQVKPTKKRQEENPPH